MQKLKRLHQHWNFPVLLILCAALLVTGCQPKKTASGADSIASEESYSAYDTYTGSFRSASDSTTSSGDNLQIRGQWENRALELVLDTASVAKGTPYVFGGSTLSGFDCSGLVRWAYSSVGVKLPRSAREQSQYGEKVSRNNLRMGDIVAFRHPRRGYHTGIYLGDDKFIHSPRRRDVVKISSLTDAYYRDTYLGARRPPISNDVDLDEVEEQLASLKAQKKALQIARQSRNLRNDTKISENARKKSKQSAQRSNGNKRKNEKASTASNKRKNEKANASSNKRKNDNKSSTSKTQNKTEQQKASSSKRNQNKANQNKTKEKATPASSSKKETASTKRESSTKRTAAASQSRQTSSKQPEKAGNASKKAEKPKTTAARNAEKNSKKNAEKNSKKASEKNKTTSARAAN